MMLFELNNDALSPVSSTAHTKEIFLESYIVKTIDQNSTGISNMVLDSSIFGEELFLVSNQITTDRKKRADILAIDRFGNGVIVELKRNTIAAGVETQALQYLAEFSPYKGKHFIDKFIKNKKS